MTIVKNSKTYEIGGKTYFVERYADKPNFVWLWRYGLMLDETNCVTISDGLLTRPNLKRLKL